MVGIACGWGQRHGKNHALFRPLLFLALRSFLNGAIPGVKRCGWVMYKGGVAELGAW